MIVAQADRRFNCFSKALAEKRGLEPWEKIVSFTKDEWFPSRLPFGKLKGRRYQEARENAELRSWLEWLAEEARALAGDVPFSVIYSIQSEGLFQWQEPGQRKSSPGTKQAEHEGDGDVAHARQDISGCQEMNRLEAE